MYSWIFQPNAEGSQGSIAIFPEVTQDQALNDNVASNTITFYYDTTRPMTYISPVAFEGLHSPWITNTQPIQIAVTFTGAPLPPLTSPPRCPNALMRAV